MTARWVLGIEILEGKACMERKHCITNCQANVPGSRRINVNVEISDYAGGESGKYPAQRIACMV